LQLQAIDLHQTKNLCISDEDGAICDKFHEEARKKLQEWYDSDPDVKKKLVEMKKIVNQILEMDKARRR
jgi:hypothetical protein